VNIYPRLKQRYEYSIILLRELVITDFKLRYQASALGYLWSILKPLLLFVILYFVFGVLIGATGGVPHYPVYLLLGVLLWNYFSEVTNIGATSIVAKGDLLRKLNFPKYVIVVAGSISAFINLVINFIVIAVFMAINGVELHFHSLLLIPLLLELFILSIGIAFLLSALYVKLRDINYIWEVFMQAAFYATPIIYPLTLVVAKSHLAAQLLLLNPMAQIIQDARNVLVTDQSLSFEALYGSGWYRLIPIIMTLVIGIGAAYYFRKRSPYFAEEI
jgi:ABC-2 type transport system permease protein